MSSRYLSILPQHNRETFLGDFVVRGAMKRENLWKWGHLIFVSFVHHWSMKMCRIERS